MTLRSKVWLAVAVLLTLVNLAGIGMAAMAGEVRHTAAHVALTVLGAYWVRRVWRGAEATSVSVESPVAADHLAQLEQSVDAVAIEVERIGEGQRFLTHLFAEKRSPPAPAERAAPPTEAKPPKSAPSDERGER